MASQIRLMQLFSSLALFLKFSIRNISINTCFHKSTDKSSKSRVTEIKCPTEFKSVSGSFLLVFNIWHVPRMLWIFRWPRFVFFPLILHPRKKCVISYNMLKHSQVQCRWLTMYIVVLKANNEQTGHVYYVKWDPQHSIMSTLLMLSSTEWENIFEKNCSRNSFTEDGIESWVLLLNRTHDSWIWNYRSGQWYIFSNCSSQQIRTKPMIQSNQTPHLFNIYRHNSNHHFSQTETARSSSYSRFMVLILWRQKPEIQSVSWCFQFLKL